MYRERERKRQGETVMKQIWQNVRSTLCMSSAMYDSNT